MKTTSAAQRKIIGLITLELLTAALISVLLDFNQRREKMKKTILLAMALMSFNSVADDADCSAFYELAENIMDARQSGVPMPKMLEMLDEYKHVTTPIVLSAYKMSRYRTERIKKEVVEEFATKWMLLCIESSKNK